MSATTWLTSEPLAWLSLLALGAYHGLNPGMGWLFAVARGLQERRRRAVLAALGPIALGHAASVAVVVGLVGLAQLWVEPAVVRLAGGGALLAFGLYKLLAPFSHPRWVGMRVGGRELASWSFLMASAHGAGLMLVPLFTRLPARAAEQAGQATHAGHAQHHGFAGQVQQMAAAGPLVGLNSAELLGVGLHTAAMFLVMGLVAVVVYERVGLAILRRGWFNLDRLWAAALLVAGVATLAT